MVLNATVVDQNLQLVETLDKSDFQVYEDGVPQTILGFRREDIPVSLGILIDSSGSMYNKVDAVRTAAMDLIKASNAEDETFIVNFSEEAYIDQDLTSDVDKLRDALNLFHVAGGTAIYDTVMASADYLSQNAKKPKQVLLIITDGDDRDSTSNLEIDDPPRAGPGWAGGLLHRAALRLGRYGPRLDTALAAGAAGRWPTRRAASRSFPSGWRMWMRSRTRWRQDIRSQYTISYHSTRPYTQAGYRPIRVDGEGEGLWAAQCADSQRILSQGAGIGDAGGE